MGLITVVVLIGHLLFPAAKAVKLWTAPAAIPTNVPAACRAALVQNITCNYGKNNLVTAAQAASGLALISSEAGTYCTTSCYESLKTFQANVDAKCGSTQYALYVNSSYTQSAAALADGLSWAYNLTCIKDASGFCLWDLYAGNETACSDCALKYGAAMLSSDYGRAKLSPGKFSSTLSSCSADPKSYTYTYSSTATLTANETTTTAASTPTCTGKTYTVQSSDTCQSVSKGNGVGTDLMINRNHLDYNCSVLSTGMSLCLQDTCTIYTLEGNETCDGILKGKSFTTIQLVSWNPTIHTNCDNLASMKGRSICLSPPGGGTFEYNSSVSHAPLPTLNSSFITNWVPATGMIPTTNFTTSWYSSVFNSTAKASITSTASNNETLASELAQQTKYCWLTDDDLESLDEEEYTEGCQSLMDEYCFPTPGAPVPPSPSRIPSQCTPNRSTYMTGTPTSSSAPSATPTPYQAGMIAGCKQFYKVLSGDTCQKIADTFSITLTQFRGWNPAVGDSCESLFLGYYVCVRA
ncbi:hypothetical protein F4813DRAFT_388904 [Daldinia decipiens]|uniref:uncharacterized protein n=1 Tax=Daldinia decipiens TaxID=326647 RepID=UPI0020C4D69A|nr:uncharacterized protein F4813DRAFT_388904 [Daldinia decipiens]KAI1658124.1 hypothetical protein F4813DRAFT_388904 [Daldinia decipiens]